MNQFPHHQDTSCMEVQDTLEAYLADELDADTHATSRSTCSILPKVSR